MSSSMQLDSEIADVELTIRCYGARPDPPQISIYDFIFLVDQHRDIVVGVQINCPVQFHLVSSFEVWGWLIPPTLRLSEKPSR